MNRILHESKVAICYHQLLHDPSLPPYRPNATWDEDTSKLLQLLLINLPDNSSDRQLADIGSGAGKWTALLAPYFNHITSIEPNPRFQHLQEKLCDRLSLGNVDIRSGIMPDCIYNLHCECALLVGSIYLTEDWHMIYDSMLRHDNLRWIAIADGPDTYGFDDTGWNTPCGSISNRRPLLIGDEWHMHNEAVNEGWTARLFNIEYAKSCEPNEMSDRWLLILER